MVSYDSYYNHVFDIRLGVLILVVVDNGLVHVIARGMNADDPVLILVVVDNGLVPGDVMRGIAASKGS